jgi:ABC-type glycerol-3-phosphate transport system permease component
VGEPGQHIRGTNFAHSGKRLWHFSVAAVFPHNPVELEEAAALDGANRWQILWRVMLPLSRPALVTLFLFTFIAEWNDYLNRSFSPHDQN